MADEPLVRVVATSNFDKEVFEEKFEGDPMSRRDAEAYCSILNVNPLQSNWYVVRPLDYKLYKWEP